MFDTLPDPVTCGQMTAAELVTAIRQYNTAVATSTARVWAFAAKLLALREADAADEEKLWIYDPWAAAKDEIAAAMSLSPRRASGQMRIAEALAVRLPKTAECLESGAINARVAAAIVYRTELVSPAAQPLIDAEIAQRAGSWTTHSDDDLELAVDAIIEEHDPHAVRRYRDAAAGRDVQCGKPDDVTGTASLYGRLSAVDADLTIRVLNAMADTVCRHDPSSRGELRAAAHGAIFRGHDRLVCLCGHPDCPAATIPSTVRTVMIHILAESGTLTAALAEVAAAQHVPPQGPTGPTPATVDLEAIARETDQAAAATTSAQPQSPWPWDNPTDETDETDWAHPPTTPAADKDERDNTDQGNGDGEDPPFADPDPGTPPPGPDHPDAGTAATPNPPASQTIRPAVSLDGRIIPTLLLAELIRTGATVTPLPRPADDPEPHYAFSQQLRRFITVRDMRCCFPGCNRTAEHLDIDHTIPHAEHGATHASNGKLLCREHHLAKTFTNWTDEQLLNGDILWTAPTGHSYLTEPRARLLFPHWDTTTSSMPFIHPRHRRRHKADPGTTMPTRQTTRAQDRQQHINTQREHNALLRALDGPNGPPPRSPFR